MNITLNNKPESFEQDSLSVSEVLKVKRFTFKLLVIKINGKLIRKPEYESSFVKDGDDLQIIHMISGG
ncbi:MULTISPECIES: sulfur carrier protein ThiS [unclassified Lentimicrobium]|uniref:sulfur carrier protein ThiS n=1 Tax=unclassified Lentimicrobium TaxID=2677434 RepID=UPI001553A858|nr:MULTISPECIES: sulfur carrier protein ThiS [unclassified Lentimicrobium]NPD46796.1 sulfur carrier protein ThiS [Lentimicrobium sp. S6]NPD85599.1 sulfur carrier protein ThiS [Lentimicrobium sp. L6]